MGHSTVYTTMENDERSGRRLGYVIVFHFFATCNIVQTSRSLFVRDESRGLVQATGQMEREAEHHHEGSIRKPVASNYIIKRYWIDIAYSLLMCVHHMRDRCSLWFGIQAVRGV